MLAFLDSVFSGSYLEDITINCIEASYADQNMNAGAEGFVQWTHNTNNGFLNNGINSFTTTDGMIWRMPYTNFTAVNNEGVAIPTIADIWVDVNGEKGPNLVDADLRETPNATCDPDDDPDTFFITVRADGKIEVNGACAREYVSDMTLMHKR